MVRVVEEEVVKGRLKHRGIKEISVNKNSWDPPASEFSKKPPVDQEVLEKYREEVPVATRAEESEGASPLQLPAGGPSQPEQVISEGPALVYTEPSPPQEILLEETLLQETLPQETLPQETLPQETLAQELPPQGPFQGALDEQGYQSPPPNFTVTSPEGIGAPLAIDAPLPEHEQRPKHHRKHRHEHKDKDKGKGKGKYRHHDGELPPNVLEKGKERVLEDGRQQPQPPVPIVRRDLALEEPFGGSSKLSTASNKSIYEGHTSMGFQSMDNCAPRSLTFSQNFVTSPLAYLRERDARKNIPILFNLLQITVKEVRKAITSKRPFGHSWFVIKLRYGSVPYEWVVKRTHGDIVRMHSQLRLIYLSHRKAEKLPSPPHLSSVEQKRNLAPLQNYLRVLFAMSHPPSAKLVLCSFIACSSHSFFPGQGPKPLEGFVEKRSGGRRIEGPFHRVKVWVQLLNRRFSKKWITISESHIAYYKGNGNEVPQELLLCDQHFNVTLKSKKGKVGIHVENGYRRLFFSPPKRDLHEMYDAVVKIMSDNPWAQTHRFSSFAPERHLIPARFFIDGEAYFAGVAQGLESAQSTIFIADWWLSPEVFLRRPPAEHPESRIDRILLKKAKEGVKIYLLHFKEMRGSLPNDSAHTKNYFKNLHENITAMRFPDHVAAGTFKWANHEKIVVIDQSVGFLGGVDLCFGRCDSPSHSLTDVDAKIWPGKDYSNPLKKDFFELNKPFEDSVDRKTVPRMPWHDIGMRIEGQAARDLARHFIGRWNYAKICKKRGQKKIPLLVPLGHFSAPKADQGSMELVSQISTASGFEPQLVASTEGPYILHDRPPIGTHNVQLVRSVGRWSAGTFTETSIINALSTVILEAKHYVYIENQFFLTNTLPCKTSIENNLGLSIFKRIKEAHEKKQNFHMFVVLPLKPGFEGDINQIAAVPVRKVMERQNQCIARSHGYSLVEKLQAEGIEVSKYLTFHGLRTTGYLNNELITEQIYVHAKILIADDKVAVLGSANLNDRSLLGNRDTEIAAVVSDADEIDTVMDGKPYRAGRSIFELRCKLFEEHLGITPTRGKHARGHEHAIVEDPISEAFVKGVWMATSNRNTELFRECFHCTPDDTVTTFAELRDFVETPNPDYDTQREIISQIRGNLVNFAYHFLENEKVDGAPLLAPDFLAPSDIFL